MFRIKLYRRAVLGLFQVVKKYWKITRSIIYVCIVELQSSAQTWIILLSNLIIAEKGKIEEQVQFMQT